jgi:hypothetical protein
MSAGRPPGEVGSNSKVWPVARCHAYAFLHTEDQFSKEMLPCIGDGFAAGDRAVHIGDPS